MPLIDSISKIRRSYNDSSLGSRVNNSPPGILVEGVSRVTTDLVDKFLYSSIGVLSLGSAAICYKKSPLASFFLTTFGFANILSILTPKDYEPTSELYSHNSLLYEPIKPPNNGLEGKFMQRVPITSALKKSFGNLFSYGQSKN